MPAALLFCLVVAGTVIGLAGTDLVLPAIPGLPDSLEGSLESAQLVLAGFTAGTATGLLVFGELGARYDQKKLLIAALAGYCMFSWLATVSNTITELSVFRLFQGFMAAAPAVFAPGMIRTLFDERGALRALGLMGSIESVVPALAPVVGAWLLTYFDWRVSFYITAASALILTCLWVMVPYPREAPAGIARHGNYLTLLASPVFQRYSLSQAFTLGGLLIFVFGAPTIMTITMSGTLSDFVTMQVIGISFFIVCTNLSHRVVDRLGNERTIMLGSLLCAGGTLSILVYGLLFDPDPRVIWFLFSFVNAGLGLRGPPGFYLAVIASGDNDARGAALVGLSVFLTVAAGTAALAPFIALGLVPLAGLASLVSVASVVVLRLLPPLEHEVG